MKKNEIGRLKNLLLVLLASTMVFGVIQPDFFQKIFAEEANIEDAQQPVELTGDEVVDEANMLKQQEEQKKKEEEELKRIEEELEKEKLKEQQKAIEKEQQKEIEEKEELAIEQAQEPVEEVEAMAMFARAGPVATVSSWDDLVSALGDTSINQIVIAKDIARGKSKKDLPAITRSVTIEGQRNSIDFGTVDSAFILGEVDSTTNFILKEMSATKVGPSALIKTKSSGRRSANWEVTVMDSGASQTTNSSLATIGDSRLTIGGFLIWASQGSSATPIKASHVTFAGGSVVKLVSDTTTIELDASGNSVVGIDASNNADVEVYAKSNQAILASLSSSNTWEMNLTTGARLYAYGDGSGIAAEGATVSVVASSGSFNINSGATFEVNSRGAQPAIVQQIKDGTFNVDGENTKMLLTSAAQSNEYGATIRFRSVPNQSFSVTNNGYVKINKQSGDAPAIRFGNGSGNNFYVKSGGHVRIENEGTNSPLDPGKMNRNQGIVYAANDYGFYIDGYRSAVEIVARNGAAVDSMGKKNGVIDLSNGGIFIAEGRTASKEEAIFNAADPLTIKVDNPLYYDFVNKRQGGGYIFSVGKNATFASKNSDLAVWEMGKDINGDPQKKWTLIDYNLDGVDFSNIANTNVPEEFNSSPDSYGNIGVKAYTRMSGNNASAKITDIFASTNADKSIYGEIKVPEGLNFEGRPAWGGEVNLTIKQTKPDGTEKMHTGISFDQLELFELGLRQGVFKGELGEFAETGDTYQVVAAWRGGADSTSGRVHVSLPEDITQKVITVSDVTPPLPVTITSGNVHQQTKHIEGTWKLDAAHNSDAPVSLRVTLNGANLDGTSSLNEDGTWSFDLPEGQTMNENDVLQFFLVDENGNENPTSTKDYHDATFIEGTKVNVEKTQFTIDAKDIIIGMESAKSIVKKEDFIALSSAIAKNITTNKDLEVEVKETNFIAKPGIYTIIFNIKGQSEFTVTKSIEVLEYDVVEADDEYIIAANHFTTNAKVAGEIEHRQIIDMSSATAWKKSERDKEIAVEVESHNIIGSVGQYNATLRIVDQPKVKAKINVSVDNRNAPVLVVDTPIELQVGETFEYKKAIVSASDVEDGDLTEKVVYTGEVDVHKHGVYVLEYSITDSDFNTVKKPVVVVVNNGDYEVTNDYILHSTSFAVDMLTMSATNEEIMTLAEVKAWDSKDGRVVEAFIKDNGGYQKVKGVYDIQTAVRLKEDVTRDIKGSVMYDPVIRDEYAISAKEVHINTTVATNIANDKLIELTEAYGIKINTGTPEAVEVVTHNVTGTVGEYTVTFKVVADPETTKTVKVFVDNGNAPELEVKTPIKILVGEEFDYNSAVVKAYDQEDGDLKHKVEHQGEVDSAKHGVYVLTYSLTDSDFNTVTKPVVVVVDNGNYAVDEYILYSESFVADITTMDASDTEILSLSKAKAWNGIDGSEATPVVKDNGGYTKADGSYHIETAVKEKADVIRKIVGTVLYKPTILDEYAISSRPASMNTTVATKIKNEKLIELTKAKAVLIKDGSNAPVEVSKHNVVGVSGEYEATFNIIVKPEAKSTSEISVNDGSGPVLEVKTPHHIDNGATFDYEAAIISATDAEDGDLVHKVVHTGKVDSSKDGIYTLEYSVTDSDFNKTTKIVVVGVGENIEITPEHVIYSESFVADVTTMDGSNEEILTLSKTSAVDAITGLSVDVEVRDNGGYQIKEGKYQIQTAVVGDDDAVRNITGTVMYKPTIKDKYAISSKPIQINTTVATNIENSKLIELTDAKAVLIKDGSDTPVEVTSHNVVGVAGDYKATFNIASKADIQSESKVVVSDGHAPQLEVKTPIHLDLDDTFEYSDAVISASDVEDGDLTSEVKHVGEVDTSKEGIYTLEYSVTDSDFNKTVKTVVVGVGDNTKVTPEYVIYSESFVADVTTMDGSNEEILTLSKTSAVDAITGLSVDIEVRDNGGYQIKEGKYQIQTAVVGDDDAVRNITGTVMYKPTIKDKYAISSKPIQINTTVATNIENSKLIELTDAKAVLIKDGSDTPVEVTSHNVKGIAGTYKATFNIVSHTDIKTDSAVSVNDGNAPELVVKTPIHLNVGDTFNYEDAIVSASDVEDGDLTSKVTHIGEVDTSKEEAFVLEYLVTDSDFNTTRKNVVVAVGDDFEVTDDYVIHSSSFIADVTTMDGTNEEILRLSNTYALDAYTGKPVSVEVRDNGGYQIKEGKYQIKTAVVGDVKAVRNITGTVMHNPTIGEKYAISAKPITINTTVAGNITNDELIKLTDAYAVKIKDGSSANVKVVSHNVKGVKGVYQVTFQVVEEPETQINVDVTVDNRNMPLLEVNSPIVISLGDAFNYKRAIKKAYDQEDGDLSERVTHTGSVDSKYEGIYVLKYSVKDSDFNEVTKPVVVVVQGGNIDVHDYSLYSKNFVIDVEDVTGSNEEIIKESKSYAVNNTTAENAVVEVKDNGGYKAAEAVYKIKTGVAKDKTTTRDILGIVMYQPVDGKDYAISAKPFLTNTTVAGSITDEQLIEMASAYAIDKRDGSSAEVEVVSHNVKGAKGVYQATFAVVSEPETQVTIDVSVDDRNAPNLEVNTPIELFVGDTFDYSSGVVSATDIEDGNLIEKVTHTGEVDTTKAGIYVVEYTVSDSDFNKVSKKIVVVVNDGTYVVNEDYVLRSLSFAKLAKDVKGSDVEILSESKTEAWDAHSGERVDVKVIDNGGYKNVAAAYKITVAVDPKGTQATKVLTKEITGLVLDGDYIFEYEDYVITASDASVTAEEASKLTDDTIITLMKAKGYKLNNYVVKGGKANTTVSEEKVEIVGKHGVQAKKGKYPVEFQIVTNSKVRVGATLEVRTDLVIPVEETPATGIAAVNIPYFVFASASSLTILLIILKRRNEEEEQED